MVSMKQPSLTILEAFAIPISTKLQRLDGGQGTTYLAGDFILKPVFNVDEANWVAGVYDSMAQIGFRVPAPVAAISDNWVYEGWTAWEHLEGRTLAGGRYKER